MTRARRPQSVPREAHRAWLEQKLLTDPCPCSRRHAARELGKVWAEETLEKIQKALA